MSASVVRDLSVEVVEEGAPDQGSVGRPREFPVGGVGGAVVETGQEALPVLAGVRGPGRVEAAVESPDLAGAFVRPLDFAARRGFGDAAAAPGFGLSDLADPAPAVPAVRGEVVVPPGVGDRQQGPGPGPVPIAALPARAEFVEEVGMGLLGAPGAGPFPGGEGRPEVGPVDRPQAAVTAESNPHRFPGDRVRPLLLPPPALLPQQRGEFALEPAEGPAFGEGAVDGGAEVAEEVEVHGPGDGEDEGVVFGPDIAFVEGDLEAAEAEGLERFLRRRAPEPEAETPGTVSHLRRGRSRRGWGARR